MSRAGRIPALLRELADAFERKEQSCLYFIRSGESGLVKIGYAGSPHRRREELQAGNPELLHLITWVPGGRPVEAAAHAAFAGLRVRGEWFRLEDPLTGFISLCERLHGGSDLPEPEELRSWVLGAAS